MLFYKIHRKNPDELNSLLREVQMQELDSYQAIAFSTKDTNTQLMKERIIALLRTLRVKSIFFDQLNYSAVLLTSMKVMEKLQSCN